MSNFTENETWINKLVNELIDTKDEIANQAVTSNQLYTLIDIIFNNTSLTYYGDSIKIESDNAILDYLMVIAPDAYEKRLKKLKAEREAKKAKEDSDNG